MINAKFTALLLALVLVLAPSAKAENDASAPADAKKTAQPAKPKPKASPKPKAKSAKPEKPARPEDAPAKEQDTGTPPAEPEAESAAEHGGKLDKAEALRRANAFFNASPVLTADFVQIGADGKRSEGKLHVQRAGRVRFEYAQPATMEVVSDGARVLVRDRKLNTEQIYPIDQTPLKFLLKEKIDLEHDAKLISVNVEDSGVMVAIEDSATYGGTSKIKLVFDPKSFKLKQWDITDPQGYRTQLTLFNVDQKTTPSPALFKLEPKAKAE